jgi:2-phospho-L-lactate guanylyltransferase (CobY/MobA/RfbA family)
VISTAVFAGNAIANKSRKASLISLESRVEASQAMVCDAVTAHRTYQSTIQGEIQALQKKQSALSERIMISKQDNDHQRALNERLASDRLLEHVRAALPIRLR